MSSDEHQAEWRNLAEQASKEMDATKLLHFVTELDHLLEHDGLGGQLRKINLLQANFIKKSASPAVASGVQDFVNALVRDAVKSPSLP
jgi:hypothetical protein